jgi:alkylation response protein AidB-like acyl-CoA dehydrogenase
MAEVRRLGAAGGVDTSSWEELAAIGVFSLRVSEAAGGVGLGLAEAAVVFIELGRRLVPGPLVATEWATTAGLAGPGIGVVGVVERRGGPVLVEYLGALDRLLILDREGVWSVTPDLRAATAVPRPLDPLAPLHRLDGLPQGERVGDAAAAERLGLEGALLTAAYLVGSARAVTELAVTYSLQREQFGRPVGSFQALKHLMADMHVRSAIAESAVLVAAVALDEGVDSGDDPIRAVHTAKIAATDAAMQNAKMAIQVHGGMGYTWEVDAHLHLKRAWSLDTVFGSVDDHADALARLI